jgi:protein SCO1/2
MRTKYITRLRWMLVGILVCLSVESIRAEQRYPVRGLVLSVDRSHQTMVVSCQEIRGFMDAMVMPFTVPDTKSLESLSRGALIEFTLVVGNETSHAEDVRIKGYDSAEREPSKARRLQGLEEALRPVHRLDIGHAVPDFTLTDQQGRNIRFRQFAGKVIALNFVYTRCALPEYCYRSTNNFGVLQKQFQKRLGRDLVLLTVTFDPVHDQPGVLRDYAQIWKADPEYWHFLTGATNDVQRVCDLFGVNYVPDEGLFVHSLHTAVISRDGKLVANLEGNEFTAQQFADLVGTVLDPAR